MFNVDLFVEPFLLGQLEQVWHVGRVFEAEPRGQVDDVVARVTKVVDREAIFVIDER